MPRFFFNVYDGATYLDDVGSELPDWDAARLYGMQAAGEIIKGRSKRLALGEDWRMEVTDETGLILFRFDFTMLEAPAISHQSISKPELPET